MKSVTLCDIGHGVNVTKCRHNVDLANVVKLELCWCRYCAYQIDKTA